MISIYVSAILNKIAKSVAQKSAFLKIAVWKRKKKINK
jgi:hypothetical protein